MKNSADQGGCYYMAASHKDWVLPNSRVFKTG